MDTARVAVLRARQAASDEGDPGELMNNVTRKWLRIKKTAGVRGGTIHDIRKTVLTRLAGNVSSVDLKEIAGHASINTTLKHYVALNKAAVADRMLAAQTGQKVKRSPKKAGENPEKAGLRLAV